MSTAVLYHGTYIGSYHGCICNTQCLWSGCEPKPVSANQIHSTHGTQSPRAHETASSIIVRYTWPLELARETELRWKNSSLLLKLKACAGQRVTLLERLDWKTPCLMHTLAFYACGDGLSLGTIKSWHSSFLKSAWRDHTRCSVGIVTKSTQLLGSAMGGNTSIH